MSNVFPVPKPGKRKRGVPKDGRLILSTSQRTKQRKRLWEERQHYCMICAGWIYSFSDMELDHKNPKKMGGGERDDSDANQRLTHIWCNREKGSRRDFGLEQ